MCIKHGNYHEAKGRIPRLVIGAIYTAVKEFDQEVNGVIFQLYELEEMGPQYGYGRSNFSPLSSIDETEFERNYKTEKVC